MTLKMTQHEIISPIQPNDENEGGDNESLLIFIWRLPIYEEFAEDIAE